MADVYDITPGLIERVDEYYRARCMANASLPRLAKKLEEGKATYDDAYKYAEAIGKARADAFAHEVSSDVLPDGRMYYNIADRLMTETLSADHEVVADYAAGVQELVNKRDGISLAAQVADLDEDRIKGFIEGICNAEVYDDVAWKLGEPVVTHARTVVDDTVKKNAEFQGRAGVKATVIRNGTSKCCEWCSDLSGDYTYPNVPREVFQRHDNCKCTVDYEGRRLTAYSSGGSSRTFRDQGEQERIDERQQLAQEKSMPPEPSKIVKDLAQSGVQYNPVNNLKTQLSEAEIIEKIGGGDMTKGSCSSLTYCYIGNKCGYDVSDFRGGKSQEYFSKTSHERLISKIDGIEQQTYVVKKEASDIAKKLKELDLPHGVEYRLSCGKHAAIIRNTENGYQFLELQNATGNGWKSFEEKERLKVAGVVNGEYQFETVTEKCSMADTLKRRFGCKVGETKNILIQDGKLVTDEEGRLVLGSEMELTLVDSYKGNSEFKHVLGYINTDPDKQRKGDKGYAK